MFKDKHKQTKHQKKKWTSFI